MRAKVFSLILAIFIAGYETHGSGAIADTRTLTASETEDIAAQVEPNWNTTDFIGEGTAVDKLVVLVSVKLAQDGTIDPASLAVSVNDPGNPYARRVMDSCRRAILITRQLKLPPGKSYDRMTFRFPLSNLH